jgi:hypothetical protein
LNKVYKYRKEGTNVPGPHQNADECHPKITHAFSPRIKIALHTEEALETAETEEIEIR